MILYKDLLLEHVRMPLQRHSNSVGRKERVIEHRKRTYHLPQFCRIRCKNGFTYYVGMVSSSDRGSCCGTPGLGSSGSCFVERQPAALGAGRPRFGIGVGDVVRVFAKGRGGSGSGVGTSFSGFAAMAWLFAWSWAWIFVRVEGADFLADGVGSGLRPSPSDGDFAPKERGICAGGDASGARDNAKGALQQLPVVLGLRDVRCVAGRLRLRLRLRLRAGRRPSGWVGDLAGCSGDYPQWSFPCEVV
jgi:hypothetical protein